jgi:hypothetical protein
MSQELRAEADEHEQLFFFPFLFIHNIPNLKRVERLDWFARLRTKEDLFQTTWEAPALTEKEKY